MIVTLGRALFLGGFLQATSENQAMADVRVSDPISDRVALFVNSSLAFASAEMITAALHEAGHGIAAQWLGFSPHIYAFYENNPSGDVRQTLIVLAAGPLTSLALGIVFWTWYRWSKPRYGYSRLLLLWLALLGVMEFVNYLVVTPWLVAGDTARFADVLGWPMMVRYGLTAIGVALVVLLSRPAASAMLALAPRGVALDSALTRRRFMVRNFYLPLLAGVALTALAGIGTNPFYVGYGLLGTFGNIDIVAGARYADGRPPVESERGVDAPLRIEPVALALYAALVLCYVFAFSRGVPV